MDIITGFPTARVITSKLWLLIQSLNGTITRYTTLTNDILQRGMAMLLAILKYEPSLTGALES